MDPNLLNGALEIVRNRLLMLECVLQCSQEIDECVFHALFSDLASFAEDLLDYELEIAGEDDEEEDEED